MSADAATHSSSSENPAPSPSVHRAQAAVQSLSLVLDALPDSLASSDNPAAALLHDESLAREISARLRRPGSGAGDDNLCRWLYDTFQSNDPGLQLVVLNFTPTVAGVYLSRAITRERLAGFEAVLLALYAYETVIRGGEAETLMLPNLANPSVYHEAKAANKKTAVELNMAMVSPAMEPYGTVRSTKRARIVGVALELYLSKISFMPLASKLAFCEFCVVWAGQEESGAAATEVEQVAGEGGAKEERAGKATGRVPLPWELFQPVVRVAGHCLLGPSSSAELKANAYTAVERLHRRATQEMNPQKILATRSLLRLGNTGDDVIAEPTITTSPDESEIEALKVKARMT
ncbi:hypothetical protein Cni_G24749 [Canna indica]|uniref:Hyccin n=1 Tax=Canna indica TaxID=4628 RepID=A0AAQ3KYP2_9LILI|nr:hypothetical protein Cni_G24749 [Canna indica]